ncbi:MAG: SDR family NAD(P)-dependent oxidoreductase [Halioglobus sp.]|nr:SDR family NAD(P)-dependent oxidoreductase [Halioglobus sp.]
MNSYRDKVVVITGSATGIGLALAGQFGADHAKLVISGLPTDDIDGAVAQLRSRGITAVGSVCDVTDRAQVEALAEFAWDEFGQVDVIVNNAGIALAPTPLLQTDLAQFRALYEVNIFGVLNGIQVFGARFVEQGTPAAIYNCGSENSIYPCVPSAHAYVSSKHAVLAITELLAEEMPDYVEVAVIMPGLVKSAMTKSLGIGMETEDFAATVLRQLKAGEFYVVSHAYNRVRLDERHAAIGAAFDRYAPRYEGDDEYDIRAIIAKLTGDNP